MTHNFQGTVSHLLFGPDGNRRWATEQNVSLAEAYDLAARKVVEFMTWCFQDGLVDELSIWILQEYNLERSHDQVMPLTRAVMDCISYVCTSGIVREQDLQVKVVGELDSFFVHYDGDRDELTELLAPIKGNKGKQVNILAPYNGSKELNRAFQRCIDEGIEPRLENLASRWSFSPITLFFRTGQPDGFNRLSDYYPGAEQARLISTPIYPQDLTREDLHDVVNSYLTLRDSFDKL